MKSGSLVSVVIATYNMGKYLPFAVRSVLEQTYTHLEIHVVDDGSTDNTSEEIKQFTNDPRVHYHYQTNKGQASAKNKGIQESKGDFIAFLDADDMWMPQKLEKQLPLFGASKNVGVVYSNFRYINENGEMLTTPKLNCYRGKITGRLLVENFVPFNTTIVRRECFDEIGTFDESLSMGIDYDLWLRMSTKYEFDYIEEPTIYYRIWPGQMSKNYAKRYECAVKIMNKFLEQNPDIVNKKTIDEAWAHTYVGRGNCWFNFERDRTKALKDYLQALKHKMTYMPAWKGIVKLLIY